jgi:hypothetical protein
MDRCVVNPDGEIVLHRHMQAGPEPLLNAVAPYRADLVGCVACIFPWSGLADLCTPEGLPVVLGPARYMQAIHGGKATHETIAAQQIAVLLRGGMRPQASVSPAAMRATRDFRRRRMPRRRTRAEWRAHSQQTTRQDNRPAIGHKLASKANRQGGRPDVPLRLARSAATWTAPGSRLTTAC